MVGTVAVLSDNLMINGTGFYRTVLESFIKQAGKLSKPVDLFFFSSIGVVRLRKNFSRSSPSKIHQGDCYILQFWIVEKWFLNEFNFSGNGDIDTLLFVG